jgi:hypothetical protein
MSEPPENCSLFILKIEKCIFNYKKYSLRAVVAKNQAGQKMTLSEIQQF